MAKLDVMTGEEELAAAINIIALRRIYWRSILGYLPYTDGICELAAALLPVDRCLADALDVLRRASRALRDRDLKAHKRDFEAAREQLALALAAADLDGVVSDRVLADLDDVASGRHQTLSMNIKLPPRGSLPFIRYVSLVRSNHHALWAVKRDFVEANLRLVMAIARRFNGRMPLQDLIQEGNLGLLQAVDRYDHRTGFRFSTYAGWWIRHAIGRSIADKARTVRLPVHTIAAHNKVRRARHDFETRNGREPGEAELTQLTGVSVERLRRLNLSRVDNSVSLDEPRPGADGRTLLDTFEDDQTPMIGEMMDHEVLVASLHRALAVLSPIESDILRKRMGIDDGQEHTCVDIGARYSLSRERIRQLQEQALVKVRAEFRRQDLF